MKLFLDTSVVLAACGSANGASRLICDRSERNGWSLIATQYVLNEAVCNLDRLPPGSNVAFASLCKKVLIKPDVFTVDRPSVFGASKDRPILFGALAWADVLETLDRGDFGTLLNETFYGLSILRPGTFLERERNAGRLR